ncbi:MAG TPA: hypothetical protein PLD54_00745 [Candidatus Levybacteria bacterium]|nr:hypothetical protein [Candidatus Levybacteria bacterium]
MSSELSKNQIQQLEKLKAIYPSIEHAEGRRNWLHFNRILAEERVDGIPVSEWEVLFDGIPMDENNEYPIRQPIPNFIPSPENVAEVIDTLSISAFTAASYLYDLPNLSPYDKSFEPVHKYIINESPWGHITYEFHETNKPDQEKVVIFTKESLLKNGMAVPTTTFMAHINLKPCQFQIARYRDTIPEMNKLRSHDTNFPINTYELVDTTTRLVDFLVKQGKE